MAKSPRGEPQLLSQKWHCCRALLAAQDAAIAALKVGNVLGDARAAAEQALQVPLSCLPSPIHFESLAVEGVIALPFSKKCRRLYSFRCSAAAENE